MPRELDIHKWGDLDCFMVYGPLGDRERGHTWVLTAQSYHDWNCEDHSAVHYITEALDFAAWIIKCAPDSFVCVEQIDPPTVCFAYDKDGQPILNESLRRSEEGFMWIYLVEKAYWEANKEQFLSITDDRNYFEQILGDLVVSL